LDFRFTEFCELRIRHQPVEKVGVGRITTNNRAWKALKPGRLVADLGLKRASGEFFNTLALSTKFIPRNSHMAEALAQVDEYAATITKIGTL
jgi:hypothetical protein